MTPASVRDIQALGIAQRLSHSMYVSYTYVYCPTLSPAGARRQDVQALCRQ